MSGHITRTSRGSRVGSSASRPSSTSRSTSTWRATPWQACTCTDRSSSASTRPAGRGRSAARSLCSRPSRVSGAVGGRGSSSSVAIAADDRARCSSRVSRPRLASRGCRTRRWLSSSARSTAPPGPVRVCQSAGDGCGSQTWTSRSAASASSRSISVTDSRVWPNRESRTGRSNASGSSRSRATVAAWRSSGEGPSTRSVSRRQSSGCQARSAGSGAPAAVGVAPRGPVGHQRRPLSGVRREEPGQPACHREAPPHPEIGLVTARSVAQVLGQGGCPGLVETAVDHVEQRPGERVGSPGVVVAGAGDLGDQRPG